MHKKQFGFVYDSREKEKKKKKKKKKNYFCLSNGWKIEQK